MRTGILGAALVLLALAAGACDSRRGELTILFTSDVQGRLGPAG